MMDLKALDIVNAYILKHLDKSDPVVPFDTFIVWKAKILQNWKYLISSTLPDGMYYELTFNGDKKEWYLDAYKKFENVVLNDMDEKTNPDDYIRMHKDQTAAQKFWRNE